MIFLIGVFKNAAMGSMEKTAGSCVAITVTTTKFVTRSLETAVNARMVFKIKNVTRVRTLLLIKKI